MSRLLAAPVGLPPESLIGKAAREREISRAAAVLSVALQIPAVECAGRILPDQRDWHRANHATRLAMLGSWLLAETHEEITRSSRLYVMPDPNDTVGTRD